MTNRRKPAQRPTSAEWKPTQPRTELFKAIGAGSAVVLLTVLVIFLIKPGDSTSSTPPPAPITTPATIPTGPSGATGSLPTDSLPTDSIPTDTIPIPTPPPDTPSTPTQP